MTAAHREVDDSWIGALTVDRVAESAFTGRGLDSGGGRIFGGSVLGQAVNSAARTVDSARSINSLHCYFVLPGDPTVPVRYEIEVVRDGGTFSVRHVRAIQHDKTIFVMSASFHVDLPGLEHQLPMPDVPRPDTLPSELDQLGDELQSLPPDRADRLRRFLALLDPIEFRPVESSSLLQPVPSSAVQHVWFQSRAALPDSPLLHQCILGCISDYRFMATALRPHGVPLIGGLARAASLDHVMWFHRRVFRADEWMLYAMDSPVAAGSRGLNRGSVFTQNGTLVATTTQEGLMNVKT